MVYCVSNAWAFNDNYPTGAAHTVLAALETIRTMYMNSNNDDAKKKNVFHKWKSIRAKGVFHCANFRPNAKPLPKYSLLVDVPLDWRY